MGKTGSSRIRNLLARRSGYRGGAQRGRQDRPGCGRQRLGICDNGQWENLESVELGPAARDEVPAVALSADGKTGLVVGYSGLVLMTTDSGKTWNRSNLALQP